MIKVDLITGFLGSGKTTFLKKYARYLMELGLKIGILEYDYGSINIDMLLVGELRGKQCEIEMLAAACDKDCLERRFRTKLISMAMSGYDRVIIEPSGIFDVDMFFDSLREEPLEKWYEIGSVITIVSADLEIPLNGEANFYLGSQTSSAGCVILSKTQLADGEQIADTTKYIKKAAEEIKCTNYNPKFITKVWDDFDNNDYYMISNCGYHINDYVKMISNEISSFSSVNFLEIPKDLNRIKECVIELFDKNDYGQVMRIKGFVADAAGNYEINATSEKICITPSRVGSGTLIVIGYGLMEDKIRNLIVGE